MEEQRHYIIQDGNLKPVSEIRWTIWTEDNTQKLKVRETHLVKRGTPDVWGKVLTYFTGVDHYPGSDEPYLWQTKLFDSARFFKLGYTSEEAARRGHDQYVGDIINRLQKEGVQLDAVEIELSVNQKE